jgi:outer membrane protein OmpA-like peptidoglycan-associated protein
MTNDMPHQLPRLSTTKSLRGWSGLVGLAQLALPCLASVLLSSCASDAPLAGAEASTTVAAAPAPAVAAPITAVPLDDAVRKAAGELFANAPLAQDQKVDLVIDPLVDGNTGFQTLSTAKVEQSVIDLVKAGYPQIAVKPFNGAALATLPLIMVGTFTPINLQGKADGDKDAYRVCFALADLKTGKIISKGFARALPAGVDATPQAFFHDLPIWLRDSAVDGYIKTCQGTKAGDPIHPAYVDTVAAAAAINEATLAYDQKRYKDALAIYQAVMKNPAGRQARTQAGIYLSNLKLNRKPAAMKSFGELVDMGLAAEKLAVRFSFKPGATAFSGSAHPYSLWLTEIAKRAVKQPGCIEVGGHMARSASEPLSERLSLQRAEFVRQKLAAIQPTLGKRSSAQGYGFKQNLIGTGQGNESDDLDERIEFRRIGC